MEVKESHWYAEGRRVWKNWRVYLFARQSTGHLLVYKVLDYLNRVNSRFREGIKEFVCIQVLFIIDIFFQVPSFRKMYILYSFQALLKHFFFVQVTLSVFCPLLSVY